MNTPRLLIPNVVAGAVLAAAGAFATYQAAMLPFGSIAQPDSGFFPLCIAVLITVFALGVLADPPEAQGEATVHAKPSSSVGAMVAALVVYVFLLKPVGFVLCTVALTLLMLRYEGGFRWRTALSIAAPSAFVCDVLFTRLGVPLPAGVLGF
jgi:putative tricarboxylic transport membrane protein